MINKKYLKIIEIAKRFNYEIDIEIKNMLSNLTIEQKMEFLNGKEFSNKYNRAYCENSNRTYIGNKEVEFKASFLDVETRNKEWRLELNNFTKDWVDSILSISELDNLPEEEQDSTDIFTLTVYDYDKNHEITRIVEHYLSVCKNEEGYFLSYSNTDEPIKQQGKVYTYEGEDEPIVQNGKVVRDLSKVPTRAHLIYAMTHKPKNSGYDLTQNSEYNGKPITVHDHHELDSTENVNTKARKISKNQLYALADLPCNLTIEEELDVE